MNNKYVYLLIGIFILSFFLLFQFINLNNRLSKIENRLGGKSKISCNEKDTIEKVRQSTVRVVGGGSEGTGFHLGSKGEIYTNFHVIEYEPSPKVVFADNTFEMAEFIAVDKEADIAVLKVNKELPSVNWGEPENLDPAETLLAIGYPFGGDVIGEATVKKGSFSGKRRDKEYDINYIQSDITLNGGMSGGPMVNICGEVIGMNTTGTGGFALAISADTIFDKYLAAKTSDDPLKDVAEIELDPDAGPKEAVEAFYSYLKMQRYYSAWNLLADNYRGDFSFDEWKKNYEDSMDTSLISASLGKDRSFLEIIDGTESAKEDIEIKDEGTLVNVRLTTKDLIDDEIVTKYFRGTILVKKSTDSDKNSEKLRRRPLFENNWLLWEADIKEVKSYIELWK